MNCRIVCLSVLLTIANTYGMPEMPSGEFNSNGGRNWAVLIAGSNGWSNYRHQADVCHAYHLLVQRGINPNNIITFMFGDIANNPKNPMKGKIFNDYNFKDVYGGVKIDYMGKDVNPMMIDKVITADRELKARGFKVLDSKSEDNVFIYYSDHGGVGVLETPAGPLFAKHLNTIIMTMYMKKKYHHMVLYIEACHSGSLFEMFPPTDIDVFVMTAANANEQSFGTFCGHEKMQVCLADEFSYNWMSDTEKNDPNQLTVMQQLDHVTKMTKLSHVDRFGSKHITKEPVIKFQGGGNSNLNNINNVEPMEIRDTVIASKAHLVPYLRTLMTSNSNEERKFAQRKLTRYIELAKMLDQIVEDIMEDVQARLTIVHNSVSVENQQDCFEEFYNVFRVHCFSAQQVPELLSYTKQFQDVCKAGYDTQDLVYSILNVCA